MSSGRHSLRNDLWTNVDELSGDWSSTKQSSTLYEPWIHTLIIQLSLSKATKANDSDERQWHGSPKSIRTTAFKFKEHSMITDGLNHPALLWTSTQQTILNSLEMSVLTDCLMWVRWRDWVKRDRRSHDGRHSTPADRRSRLTSGPCSNSLNNDLGQSFG